MQQKAAKSSKKQQKAAKSSKNETRCARPSLLSLLVGFLSKKK
jgi:hypothetical protein